jgi:hypothetical protein
MSANPCTQMLSSRELYQRTRRIPPSRVSWPLGGLDARIPGDDQGGLDDARVVWIAFVVAVAWWAHPAAAQQSEEAKRLRRDLETLKEGQAAISKELQEIKGLLRHVRETLPKLDEEYIKTGKLQYVVRDLPLASIHPQAFKAAEGVEVSPSDSRRDAVPEPQSGDRRVALQREMMAIKPAWADVSCRSAPADDGMEP